MRAGRRSAGTLLAASQSAKVWSWRPGFEQVRIFELLEGFEHGVVVGVVCDEGAGRLFAEHGAVALDGGGAGFVDEGPEFGGAAVDELGAELDDAAAFDFLREDAAADAGSGFEDADAEAAFGEGAGGGEAGHAGTEDEDIDIVGHVGSAFRLGFELQVC